jgi:hypothetical protein
MIRAQCWLTFIVIGIVWNVYRSMMMLPATSTMPPPPQSTTKPKIKTTTMSLGDSALGMEFRLSHHVSSSSSSSFLPKKKMKKNDTTQPFRRRRRRNVYLSTSNVTKILLPREDHRPLWNYSTRLQQPQQQHQQLHPSRPKQSHLQSQSQPHSSSTHSPPPQQQLPLLLLPHVQTPKLTIRVPQGYQYLLNVPFYIYEEWGVPYYLPSEDTTTTTTTSSTTAAAAPLQPFLTLDGKPIDIQNMDPILPIHSVNELKTKHAEDVYLTTAAMIHPMRTMNPHEAKLFWIPTPLNLLLDRIDDLGGAQLCLHIPPASSSPPLAPTTTTVTTSTNNNDNNNTSDTICNEDLIRHVNTQLKESEWFQRYRGRDHIAIVSHWRWYYKQRRHFVDKKNNDQYEKQQRRYWKPSYIYACTLIDFENSFSTWRQKHPGPSQKYSFPSYYVGRKCPPPPIVQHPQQQQQQQLQQETNNTLVALSTKNIDETDRYHDYYNKTTDFAMITTIQPHNHKKPYRDRLNICNWIQKQQQPKQQPKRHLYKMDACGIGPQCPALAQAKFGFHARGDTPGSNRPMDAILSRTIPIFTDLEQYTVLPQWIDWNALSYFCHVSNRTVFFSDLHRITHNETLYQQKLQTLMRNMDLFDYDTMVPFDTYMYMFQVTLFPETKRVNLTSPYSALLLP